MGDDEEDTEMLEELRLRREQIGRVKRRLAIAARAPVEAAALVGEAEATVRGQFADLRQALEATPEATRDFYRGLFGEDGLSFEADHSTRPARWLVRGAAVLGAQRMVTPPGLEPGISA
jgi:hypothetical protein